MYVYFIVGLYLFFFISFRGNQIISTLYALNLQANFFEVGLIVALANLGPMVFAIMAGRVADRIGSRYPLMLGCFGLGVSLLLPYLVKDQLYILYLSQTILGIGYIFVIVNLQNLIGRLSSSENRSQNYSIFSLSVSAASLIGPSVTGFCIDFFGYNSTYLILALVAFIPSLVMLSNIFKLPEPVSKEKATLNSIKDLLNSRSLIKTYMTSAMILTGVGLYEFYFPIYGDYLGFSASAIGIILSIYAAAFFIVRSLMGYLTAKFGEDPILFSSMFTASGAFVLLPFFQGAVTLAVISFILGTGLGIGQPLSISMAYNSSPQGRTGEVLGIRMTINKTAQFLVPIVFGSVGSWLGVVPVFLTSAVFLFGAAYINLPSRRHKEENSSTLD